MNWTGGSLQRTKTAHRGNVLKQQRAYFAKARTQPQNDTHSPIAPFRPSYLRDTEDSGFIAQMSSFGSGSVRHTGNSARRRIERMRRGTTPDGRASANRAMEMEVREETSARDHESKKPNGKRPKAIDANHEIELLEANKKRLLSQQDWIGVDSSKPVSLRFQSSKEKNNIGKRRRITGARRAAMKQSQHPGPEAWPKHDTLGRMSGRGAIRMNDNIRIQIGADALTNTYSNQPNEDEQSQASPDSILFDQGEPDVQEDAEGLNLVPPVNPQLRASANAFGQPRFIPHGHRPIGENAQRYDIVRSRRPDSSPDVSEQGSSTYDHLESQSRHTITRERRMSSMPAFQLMHRVQGDERALRLVFGDSNSSAVGRGCFVSENHDIGETKSTHEPPPVRPSKAGPMRPINDDRKQSATDGASAELAMVNEGPWRTYLAISDGGSSLSDAAVESRNGTVHDHPTWQYSNEVVTDWSQHATQGDRSHNSSPTVSGSLLSGKRDIGKCMSMNLCAVDSTRREGPNKKDPQTLTEDERLWQAFVFGSDKSSSSRETQDHACGSLQEVSKDAKNAFLKYVPVSAAIGSVSSTPFATRPRLSPYMGGKLQHAAPSGSPALTVRGSVEWSDYRQGGSMTERSASVGRSLQNNASSDLISSRSRGDTKTARKSLDLADPVRDASYNPDNRTTSSRKSDLTIARHSPMHDSPVSDDMSLDLVDPDKI